MNKLLWLDDIRNPFLNEEKKVPQGFEIHWVLNYDQFVKWITLYGLPDLISFDHDLADEHYTPAYFWNSYEESKKLQEWREPFHVEKTGKDCANWLVNHCLDNDLNLPEFLVHSANPVGADSIRGLLEGFNKFKDQC
jgi:hypothetical protein